MTNTPAPLGKGRMKPTSETTPIAFINGASSFAWAAEELCKSLTPSNRQFSDPVYLLMAHAIELALKGFLRSKGVPSEALMKRPYGHHLINLYTKARSLGFEENTEVCNVVALLNDSNQNQALRYFIVQSRTLPDVGCGVEVTHRLISLAKSAVLLTDPDADKPGPLVKFDFTLKVAELPK